MTQSSVLIKGSRTYDLHFSENVYHLNYHVRLALSLLHAEIWSFYMEPSLPAFDQDALLSGGISENIGGGDGIRMLVWPRGPFDRKLSSGPISHG